MWVKFIFSFGFLAALFFVAPAFGVKCYVCTGDVGTDNDCEVNLDNVIQQDCTPGFVCSVYITTEANKSTVHRICEGANECEVLRAQSTHIMGSNRTLDSCRSCNNTLCNSSESTSSMLSVILNCFSFIIVTVVFNRFQ